MTPGPQVVRAAPNKKKYKKRENRNFSCPCILFYLIIDLTLVNKSVKIHIKRNKKKGKSQDQHKNVGSPVNKESSNTVESILRK